MRLIIAFLSLIICSSCIAQWDTAITVPLNQKWEKTYLKAIQNRTSKLERKIANTTERTLNKLRKQELKLYKKLYKKDSVAAKRTFAGFEEHYQQLNEKLNVQQHLLKEYLPGYDTMMTSVRFLESLQHADSTKDKLLKLSKNSINELGSRLQISNEIKAKLRERKQYVQHQLKGAGMVKELQRFNKTLYYYQQQLQSCKDEINDVGKIEKRVLGLLRNSRAFKSFMNRYSILSQLFPVPQTNSNTNVSFAGLQARGSVQAMLIEQFGDGGFNPQQYVYEQVQSANTELATLENKSKQLASGNNSDVDMPQGFKPNNQKTKTFLKRIEYGANIQTQKMHSYLPVTSDIAVTAGYKLNDKSIVGLGAAYKLGWGQGLDKIRISQEGISIRTFIDYKIKGSLWISGSYEQNYYQRFTNLEQIKNLGAWKQSALLGLSKKMKTGNKISKVQLLYDFLNTNGLRTQPVVIRIGYQLK